jgi:hypothetical protein
MMMATPARIKSMINAQPFRQFTVGLVGGRSFLVRHPEHAAVSVDGREMTIYDDEGPHFVEALMIDVVELVQSPSESKSEGNGA